METRNEIIDPEEFDDDLPVGRVLSRREILRLAGMAGLGLTGVAAWFGSAPILRAETGEPIDMVASPEVTEGPFFVDEKLNRSNLLQGTTRDAVTSGTPLQLKLRIFTVKNGKGVPMPGAHVDIWHCDTVGAYSDEAGGDIQQENTKGQTWLRGYQVTDQDGAVTFDTIYPGWYIGRAVHIHFKVRQYSPAGQTSYEFTSQLFFDDKLSDVVFQESAYKTRGSRPVRNTSDGIYQARSGDGTTAGSQMMLRPVKQATATGYTANFNIGIDTSRPQSRGFGGLGGPGGPGGPGGFPGGRQLITAATVPIDVLATGLRLTTDQKRAISAIQEKERGIRPAIGGPRGRSGGPGSGDGNEADQAAMQQIAAVLTPPQKKLLTGLLSDIQTITRAGLPVALLGELALTKEQMARLATVNQEQEATMRQQFERGRNSGGPPDFQKMQEMRTKSEQKVLAMLTEKQKALVEKYRKEHPDSERGGFSGPPPGGSFGGPGGPPPGM